MPVSASIYDAIGRGVQPVEDPQNALLKALKLQGAQQELQTGSMKMDEYRRGVERNNKLQQLLSGDYADDESRAGALVKGGFLDEGQKVLKNRADLNKQNTDLDAKRLEMASKRLELAGQAFGWLKDNPSPDNAIAVIDSFGQNGIWNPQQVAKAKADVMANPTPENVARLATMGYQSALSAKDQLPKIETQNLGANSRVSAISPVTLKQTTISDAPILQSADNAATQATSIENNKRSTGAQYAIAAAGRDQAGATRDAARIAADSKRIQDVEMKLADDYRVESKGWAETATAIGMVRAALKTATTNPGSALAAGTKFMKILDPTSVVRESELGMALNASGWFDRATNIANQLQSGKVMTPTQAKNLEAAADALFKEAKTAQLEIDKAFETRAKSYGANPKNIITDRGQNKPDAADPSGVDALVDKYRSKK